MSAFKQPLNATISTPGANGFAYLLDSTRWSASIAGTLQPTSSLSSPGTDSDWMTLRRCVGSILPVGQAVTAKFYTLAGGAWVHQTALDTTCPSGVSTPVTFYPGTYGANDGMIATQAGAIPPTSLSGTATVADVSVTQATQDDIPDGATAKKFIPSDVAITGGSVGGAVVGPPTVVGTAQLANGVYAVAATDCRLQVTATASVAAQVNLRAGAAGARLSVVNSGGDPATAQQVTVVPNGADTILGQASYVLDGRESAIFEYNTATTDWEVL